MAALIFAHIRSLQREQVCLPKSDCELFARGVGSVPIRNRKNPQIHTKTAL